MLCPKAEATLGAVVPILICIPLAEIAIYFQDYEIFSALVEKERERIRDAKLLTSSSYHPPSRP